MEDWQIYQIEKREQWTNELIDFLKIPSISSRKDNLNDVKRAAEWVKERLIRAGLEQVSILPTANHPVVFAQYLVDPGLPTVLIYGHFDTQPVDPLDLWDSPPFEPVVKDGKIFARGASDDKGNMLAPILAVESLIKSEGKLPINVKFLFEGQEEIGSPDLPEFIKNYKDLLSCNFAISADGGQFAEDQPSLILGLRGICALQIELSGAKGDLHSGSYGGIVQNPIHALSHLLASMRDDEGRILVEGFYDDVKTYSKEERAEIAKTPFDQYKYLDRLGLEELFGEPEYSPLERGSIRPTLEVNGIWGGYQDEGIKTVLPNKAAAKITCRLVENQNPDRIIELIARHVRKNTLPGVKSSIKVLGEGSSAYSIPADHPANIAAAEVLKDIYLISPLHIRAGGSIPVCTTLLQNLGVYTINFAFGLPDEQIHAPNEFFRLESFQKSQKAYVLYLKKLAEKAGSFGGLGSF